jgi:hypothetical protein
LDLDLLIYPGLSYPRLASELRSAILADDHHGRQLDIAEQVERQGHAEPPHPRPAFGGNVAAGPMASSAAGGVVDLTLSDDEPEEPPAIGASSSQPAAAAAAASQPPAAVVDLSGDDPPSVPVTSVGGSAAESEKKAAKRRGRVAWSWHDPTRDVWRSFSDAHSRSLDIGWRLFQSGGRSDWVELTRGSDVFAVDLSLLIMRHVQTAAETRIRRVVSRPKRKEKRSAAGKEGGEFAAAPARKKRARTDKGGGGGGSKDSRPRHKAVAPAPLVWRCTDATCEACQAAADPPMRGVAGSAVSAAEYKQPRGVVLAPKLSGGSIRPPRAAPELATTIEEKERQQRLLLQEPRLRLMRRAGPDAGGRIGYRGPTNALCIDLDPEAGRFGSLRSLRSSLHLLRCDVSRGVAQLRPLIEVLARHLARLEPHVDVEGQDEDINDVLQSGHKRRRGRRQSDASDLAGKSPALGGGEPVRYWSRSSLPAAKVAEESAIRQCLFDTLMELVPLHAPHKDDAKPALDTAFRGLELARAELTAASQQNDTATGRAGVYGGILFLTFAVEQLWQHKATLHDSLLAKDSQIRRQLIEQSVGLTEVVAEGMLRGRSISTQSFADAAWLQLGSSELAVMRTIGRLIGLIAHCDIGRPSGETEEETSTYAGGLGSQVLLMPLAQALCTAVFVRGERSSVELTHLTEWQPAQQLFVSTLQVTSPLLALLVLDLKLAPANQGRRLWLRLAGWEHIQLSEKLRQAIVGTTERSVFAAAGHLFLLASFYGAAMSVICDSSSSSSSSSSSPAASDQPYSVDRLKRVIDDEYAQQHSIPSTATTGGSSRGPPTPNPSSSSVLKPFHAPVNVCNEVIRSLELNSHRRDAAGRRLHMALVGLHAAFMHATATAAPAARPLDNDGNANRDLAPQQLTQVNAVAASSSSSCSTSSASSAPELLRSNHEGKDPGYVKVRRKGAVASLDVHEAESEEEESMDAVEDGIEEEEEFSIPDSLADDDSSDDGRRGGRRSGSSSSRRRVAKLRKATAPESSRGRQRGGEGDQQQQQQQQMKLESGPPPPPPQPEQQPQPRAFLDEQAEIDEDLSDSLCMICMELVYEPAVKGCCQYKVCKHCLVNYKACTPKGQANLCMACSKPLSEHHDDPVVVDRGYWGLIQKLCPVTVTQRKTALAAEEEEASILDTHAGDAGGSGGVVVVGGGGMRCKCDLPAQKMKPARTAMNPDNVGRFYFVCLKEGQTGQRSRGCGHFSWGEKASESQKQGIARFTF